MHWRLPVELRALLTLKDLASALRALTPLRILIDSAGERYVELAPPSEVTLVEGAGLHVRTSGAVQWSVAGVGIRAKVLAVDVMLRPSVESTPRGAALRFALELSNLDVQHSPGLVDSTILGQVNSALEDEDNALRWYFAETLQVGTDLPRVLPPTHLDFQASGARVDVSATELTLSMPVRFDVARDTDLQAQGTTP